MTNLFSVNFSNESLRLLNQTLDPVDASIQDKQRAVYALNTEKVSAVKHPLEFNKEIDRIQGVLKIVKSFGHPVPLEYKTKICPDFLRAGICVLQKDSCLHAHSTKVQYAANLLNTPEFRSIYCANRTMKHKHPEVENLKFAHYGELRQTNYNPAALDNSNIKKNWEIVGNPKREKESTEGDLLKPKKSGAIGSSTSSSSSAIPLHNLFSSPLPFDSRTLSSSSLPDNLLPEAHSTLDSPSPIFISIEEIGRSLQSLEISRFQFSTPSPSPEPSPTSSLNRCASSPSLLGASSVPQEKPSGSNLADLRLSNESPIADFSAVSSRSESPILDDSSAEVAEIFKLSESSLAVNDENEESDTPFQSNSVSLCASPSILSSSSSTTPMPETDAYIFGKTPSFSYQILYPNQARVTNLAGFRHSDSKILDVQERVKECLVRDRITPSIHTRTLRYSQHAQERLAQRQFTEEEVKKVLRTGRRVEKYDQHQNNSWRYAISAPIREGGPKMRIIFAIQKNGFDQDYVMIITIIRDPTKN
jgi:hypothetical protein